MNYSPLPEMTLVHDPDSCDLKKMQSQPGEAANIVGFIL